MLLTSQNQEMMVRTQYNKPWFVDIASKDGMSTTQEGLFEAPEVTLIK